MSATTLTVPHRFCGPPSSGNGGWTAGALAELVAGEDEEARTEKWPVISVDLRLPPPLDTPLTVTTDGAETVASYDGRAVVRARLSDAAPMVVEPVAADVARAARAHYPGRTAHPFPTCFACGVDRAEGDGLRIFPGPVADQDGATRIASTWTPHASTGKDDHVWVDALPRASLATTWAALDCIGGWAGDLTERMMVLVNMAARVDALPLIGEEHVVVGLARGREGRKTFTASSLYDADGRIVASAEHVWVEIDPATFG
ncbi:hypothetical protein [Nocardioides sp.]|uniref:hypothetical protein n=1 Tax=Nocardioides sp. TaxID=35761 RepID=UPI0035635441